MVALRHQDSSITQVRDRVRLNWPMIAAIVVTGVFWCLLASLMF